MKLTDEEKFTCWGIDNGQRVGDCWIGFHQVMFGWRVRAGWMDNDYSCHADICCGNEASFMARVLAVYSTKMQANIDEGYDPFMDLRRMSDPKPAFNDKIFMEWFEALVEELADE